MLDVCKILLAIASAQRKCHIQTVMASASGNETDLIGPKMAVILLQTTNGSVAEGSAVNPTTNHLLIFSNLGDIGTALGAS